MSSDNLHLRAREYLRLLTLNPHAEFRDGQFEAIDSLVVRQQRQLLVQRTGWGKSAVYFIAARLLRDTGKFSSAIMISPLLSLMRDQVRAGRRIISIETVNSTNRSEWKMIQGRMDADELDMLVISPERLADRMFFEYMLLPALERPALVIVDEAHCISDWGHDFRPDYQRIARILPDLRSPALGTTATANDRVIDDIRAQIDPNITIRRGPLGRDSLLLQAIDIPRFPDRLAWLAENLESLPGSGIIYTLTVRDALIISSWLNSQSPPIVAPAYYAGLSDEEKAQLEEQLRNNEVKCLVATIALGMGFDKPDLGFVVHFQRPQSVIHYYQQIGRAGRAVSTAHAILLSGDEDDTIIDYYIEAPMAYHTHADQIYNALLDSPVPMTKEHLGAMLNIRIDVIENILKRMAVLPGAPVDHDGSGWLPTGNPFVHDVSTSAAIAKSRRDERDRMREYLHTRTCLMEFLQRELNDSSAARCGRCANCASSPLVSTTVPPALAEHAQRFLLTQPSVMDVVTIKPKEYWARGASQHPSRNGTIPQRLRAEPGRVLTSWAEPGLGSQVRDGKASGIFSQALIHAARDCISHTWKPNPFPTWVTCIPSSRSRNLTRDAATRLAILLDLPFADCIVRARHGHPQKEMQNLFFQIRNLEDAFEIDQFAMYPGPVLLIDDVVDSGWTLAIAALLLRESGSGPVFPFAFARTTPR